MIVHWHGYSGLSLPKGLDVSFDLMAMWTFVYYLFEFNKFLVLKSFKTLLVTTARWTTSRGIAIQWHFVHSNETDTHAICREFPPPCLGCRGCTTLEATRKARTFVVCWHDERLWERPLKWWKWEAKGVNSCKFSSHEQTVRRSKQQTWIGQGGKLCWRLLLYIWLLKGHPCQGVCSDLYHRESCKANHLPLLIRTPWWHCDFWIILIAYSVDTVALKSEFIYSSIQRGKAQHLSGWL